MKLITLGSSSKGNCHLLEHEGSQLMLDCGVKHSKILNFLEKDKLKGILVTHSHGDHCGAVKEVSMRLNSSVKVYSNPETLKLLDILDSRKVELTEKRSYDIDVWKIVPFYVKHDVPNYNYLIKNMVTGSVVAYITDTGYIGNIQISDVDYFIIECNHDEVLVNENIKLYPENKIRFERVLSHNGHLGISKCKDFLSTRANLNTKKVVLCHISKGGYIEGKFKREIESMFKEMGMNIQVYELDPRSDDAYKTIHLQEKLFDFDSMVE